MNQLQNFIHQINSVKNIHRQLHEKLKVGLEQKHRSKVDSEYLYGVNEPQYYVLLRGLCDFERFLQQQHPNLTDQEQKYYQQLNLCGRTLLRTVKFFPKLTYQLWQKSLGNGDDYFCDQLFASNYSRYLSLENECIRQFKQMKESFI